MYMVSNDTIRYLVWRLSEIGAISAGAVYFELLTFADIEGEIGGTAASIVFVVLLAAGLVSLFDEFVGLDAVLD